MADAKEWISTGLYLSPGMGTDMEFPAQIVGKGWKVSLDILNVPMWPT